MVAHTGILARDPVYRATLLKYRKDMVPLTGNIGSRTGCCTIFVIERENRRRVTAVWRAVKVFLVAHLAVVETEVLSWREGNDFADRVRRQRPRRIAAPLEYNVLGSVRGARRVRLKPPKFVDFACVGSRIEI